MLQRSGDFDTSIVLRQLRSAGMLVTTRVRALGYPVRMAFRQFINRYSFMFASSGWKEVTAEALSCEAQSSADSEESISTNNDNTNNTSQQSLDANRYNAMQLADLMRQSGLIGEGDCEFGISKVFLRYATAEGYTSRFSLVLSKG